MQTSAKISNKSFSWWLKKGLKWMIVSKIKNDGASSKGVEYLKEKASCACDRWAAGRRGNVGGRTSEICPSRTQYASPNLDSRRPKRWEAWQAFLVQFKHSNLLLFWSFYLRNRSQKLLKLRLRKAEKLLLKLISYCILLRAHLSSNHINMKQMAEKSSLDQKWLNALKPNP